jgi:protein CpxP
MSMKLSRILAVAAASLAIGTGAATAYAAQPGGPGGWHHGHFMQELNKLHGELHLNADQQKLWQAALDTMKQNRDAARAAHRQMHEQMKSMMQQPILDLNAMHDLHEKAEDQNHQRREQTAAAWLNFYNSLNDQQKTTVSTALKQRWAKMEARHQKMRERWEHHQQKGAAAAPASAAQ